MGFRVTHVKYTNWVSTGAAAGGVWQLVQGVSGPSPGGGYSGMMVISRVQLKIVMLRDKEASQRLV